MCNFRKLNGRKNAKPALIGNMVMVSLAVTLFLMLNVVLSQNVEARTRGSSGFGIYMTLVNPVQVRYDTFFHREAPRPINLSAEEPSYVAEMVVSAWTAPSSIILPDGVRISTEKIRPRTPSRVVTSTRIFDNRVEIPPKMEIVYSLKIDNPPKNSSGISEVVIIILYE